MFEITTEYPIWFFPLCFLVGLVFSMLLYFRNKRSKEWPKSIQYLAAILRFVAISFICFFLLGPLLKRKIIEEEKPIIVFAQDNSQSIRVNADSSYYDSTYGREVRSEIDKLQEKFQVDKYHFGNYVLQELKFDFKEKQTDLSALLQEIYNRYHNRNVGALVIASDGLFNKGSNPIYQVNKLEFPIYTLALGDTARQQDVLIRSVDHNRITFLGNKFPLHITAHAQKFKGKSATLAVYHKGEKLYSNTVQIQSNQFKWEEEVTIEAKDPGTQKYTIVVSEFDGEISYVNNRYNAFVEVLDSRQKIAIIASAPHPDVGALKQCIEQFENYEVEVLSAKKATKNLEAYNLIVVHNAFSDQYAQLQNAIEASKAPVLYILGRESNISTFNFKSLGLKIQNNRAKFNESQATSNEEFDLFTLSNATQNLIVDYPPLVAPFGTYKLSAGTQTLLSQKIGMIETEFPLFYFTTINSKKTGVICGEGLWRWRLYNYATENNFAGFNELISKSIQYLALKENKSRFRIESKKLFNEDEPVLFKAEVYNQSYELTTDNPVKIEIANQENKRFQYEFNTNGNQYFLDAGFLPAGDYTYTASVTEDGEVSYLKGSFMVKAVQVELNNTVANHNLLYNISKNSGGEALTVSKLSELSNLLSSREDIVSISYEKNEFKDLIDVKWLFGILILLFGIEWFMRKYQGSY